METDLGFPGSLWTEDLCARFSAFARTSKEQLFIIAPFITRHGLEAVSRDVSAPNVRVITTWNVPDLVSGSSDLSIYPYLRSRRWELRLHRSLHAKLLVQDWRSAIISTANITQSGLGILAEGNVECAHLIKQLASADRRWLFWLLCDSVPVNDESYAFYCVDSSSARGAAPKRVLFTEAPVAHESSTHADAARLPATRSPKQLLSNLVTASCGTQSLSPEALQATLHDVHLFGLAPMGSVPVTPELLRDRFFDLAIVQNVLRFIDEGRYFGELKRWLRTFLSGGIAPTRPELTTCTQVLLTWIIGCSGGAYRVERPHHSQRIVRIPGLSRRGGIGFLNGEELYDNRSFEAPAYRTAGH